MSKIMTDLGTTIGSEFKSHRVRIENLELGKVDKGTMFYTNNRAITTSYVVNAGENTMSIGPVEIADTAYVMVSDNAVWHII